MPPSLVVWSGSRGGPGIVIGNMSNRASTAARAQDHTIRRVRDSGDPFPRGPYHQGREGD